MNKRVNLGTKIANNKFVINKGQLALLILLLFPIQIPLFSGSTALYMGTGLYIGAATVMLMLMHKLLSMSKGGRIIFLSLVLVIGYCFFRIIISFLFGDAELASQDINELIRLYGLLMFFYLGVSIGNTVSYFITQKVFYLVVFLLTYLLVAFIFPKLQFPLYDLYVTRGGRFSGLSFGVNYVFAHVIILISLANILKNEGYQVNLYLVFYSYFIIFIWLILSGSRSSWVVVVLFFLFLVLTSDLKFKIKAFGYILASLVVAIGLLNLINIPWLERPVSRLNEIVLMIRAIDYTQVPALESRVIEAINRFGLIMQSPLFGYGIDRTNEPGFHTNYLRSLYRYGFVGLFFELLFYVALFWNAWRLRYISFAKYIAGLVLAFLIAGSVSLVWYELRVPYIFCAVAGILSAREFKYRLGIKNGSVPIANSQNNFYRHPISC